MKKTIHPKKDDKNNLVTIKTPSKPTPLESWQNPAEIATVTPDDDMPAELNGIPFSPWVDVPNTEGQWTRVSGQHGGLFDEPIFTPTPGKKTAAGVVIEEADGRVWVVHPTNAFGGYQATFPKGTVENGGTLQTTAIKEAFEESGLQVEITGYLADTERSQSKTRYYFARRVGGTPAEMGWESQGTSLVPLAMLGDVLTHPNDAALVKALRQEKRPARRDIIKYQFGLASGNRILITVNRFRRNYGVWPHRLLMEKGMVDALMTDVLTSLGWSMLASKLEIVPIEEGTVIAEDNDGSRCDYNNIEGGEQVPDTGPYADEWIWGIRLAQ